ncbi:sensor histidine kinase [Nonomuraea gerenzanensis]|uniref:histidine kinase n=1 Tax=Nonomuraea gerenzanensis TaxID=93944 RepID=A0A1M4DVF8_9ACTN|nr:histidine kinase [Nonomuraea gerenzanensis]UBU12889.1 histidine kinase [Nonomuraea gerenzanensis]SBO90545.1 two component sensor kinase [Nonomuraea gerenzanensis]
MAWVVAVVAADVALLWLDDPTAGLVPYAVLTGLAMAASRRWPFPAFLAALTMAVLSGAAYALLICTGYRTGQRIVTRAHVAATAGAVLAYAGVLAMVAQRSALEPGPVLARVALLTVLPVLAGRYLTRQRELSADEERRRIARDMHDSLGHLLGLVSVQAAALEVSALPPDQRQAVRGLAGSARAAVAELHTVVSTLRRSPGPGLEGVPALVERFRAAGGRVTLVRSGEPGHVAGQGAAYRVVQEGLTNAARHAPGAPVQVTLGWEADALLVTVSNPLPGGHRAAGGGNGLAGLAERVREEGGLLRVHAGPHEFRLVAMLPLLVGVNA